MSFRLLVRRVAVALVPVCSLFGAQMAHAQGAGQKTGKTAADSTPKALVVNKPAAIVNTEPILMSEVMGRVFRMLGQNANPDSALVDTLMRVAVKDLTGDELLVQKARAEKIEISESDIKTKTDEDMKEIRGKFSSDAEMLAAVKQNGFGSVEELRADRENQMRREMLVRDLQAKFKRDGKIPAVNVSDAEVTAEFEASKATLPKKMASVGFRQIVLPLSPSESAKARARSKADSLRKELEAHPQDFETTAKRESMDQGSKELGGDLGWTRRGVTVPAFERALFALNPGVISPVVETGFGYHIIRVDRVQPAEVKAHHILIKFSVDSLDERRALKLADSVAKLWRGGTSYDTLVAHFHDEANDEARSVPEYTRDSLPLSYQKAIAEHKSGDIVGPFSIDDPSTGLKKPVVLQLTKVEDAGEYTITELRQRIRENLVERRSLERFVNSLQNAAYVWINPELKMQPKAAPKNVP